jgi:hypothetical protein
VNLRTGSLEEEEMNNTINQRLFELETDLDFYCYLKAHLPGEYIIVSEPSKSYYSEWHFNYMIYYKGALFKEYSGNFNDLERGYLVRAAKKILYDIGAEEC